MFALLYTWTSVIPLLSMSLIRYCENVSAGVEISSSSDFSPCLSRESMREDDTPNCLSLNSSILATEKPLVFSVDFLSVSCAATKIFQYLRFYGRQKPGSVHKHHIYGHILISDKIQNDLFRCVISRRKRITVYA